MEILWQDLRYAARGFRRSPVFTLTAVLAIALGIGATTAVFSVVDRLLFRSLPYPDSDRLVSVGIMAPALDNQEFMLGTAYVQWRQHETPFEGLTSQLPGTADCDLTAENPVRLHCAQVESTFLPTLGVQPMLGRNFTRTEDEPHAPKVALLSYGLWQTRFGGVPSAIGKTIPLDGQPVTVVGVLPADFELPTLSQTDVVVPQALDEARQRPPSTGAFLRAFARLKPGVTIAQAKAALQPLFEELLRAAPPEFRNEVTLEVRSLRDRQIHDVKLASWLLLGSVLAVLLIACANVANLFLARAANRRREVAVRAALGGGRARLMRQALTESLLLAVIGAAAGCAFAYALLRVFIAIAPGGIPRLQQAALDQRVLLFTLCVSVFSGVLFGLAPALESPRAEDLGARRGVVRGLGFFRQFLVSAQIAVSLILLTGAGLLLRSLRSLENAPLGMQPESVLTAQIALGQQRYADPAQQVRFFEELEARLQRIPGVTALAISDSLPPSGQEHGKPYFAMRVAGRPPFEEGTGGMVAWRAVTPGYFSTLGIPILRGRGFVEEDRNPSENVVILSDSLARRMFPNEDPLGRQIRLDPDSKSWFAVIGIAGNVKNAGLAARADPEYYVVRKHSTENAESDSAVIIRSPMNPRAAAHWMRAAVSDLDPTLPVNIETMSQRVGKLAQRPRFDAVLLGLFAGMGVLLAAIGIYSVIAFLVGQRTQEIGVRMALGAQPRDILRLVLGKGLKVIVAGTVVGLFFALAVTRLLKSLLFGVTPNDPFTLAGVTLLLAGVALAACYLPARRAMRLDPMVALRYE